MFSLEKRKLKEDHINVHKYLQGRCQDSSVGPSDRTKRKGHKLKTQEVPHQHEEELLYVEGGRALQQAAKKARGVSISGEFSSIRNMKMRDRTSK